jgi:hypothetical protein
MRSPVTGGSRRCSARTPAIGGITKWEVSAGDATLALGPQRAQAVLEALLAG